jgi:hypothetical protein
LPQAAREASVTAKTTARRVIVRPPGESCLESFHR